MRAFFQGGDYLLSRFPIANHHQRRDMVVIDGSDKKLNKKRLTKCEPSSKGAITYSPAFAVPSA